MYNYTPNLVYWSGSDYLTLYAQAKFMSNEHKMALILVCILIFYKEVDYNF